MHVGAKLVSELSVNRMNERIFQSFYYACRIGRPSLRSIQFRANLKVDTDDTDDLSCMCYQLLILYVLAS